MFGAKEEVKAPSENGLTYSNAVIGDLVSKDTDGDGVVDWEEGLWGTDPTQKETTPGVPDSAAIAKLKAADENGLDTKSASNANDQKLTETDKFSRELFTTVATLNQSGSLDQTTTEQITSSLADHIQNSTPKKIYTLADIKTTNDSSAKAVKKYRDALTAIFEKNPAPDYTATDVLQKFVGDGNEVDTSVLPQLDAIVISLHGVINAMAKMNVPESLVSIHVDYLNGVERVVENLSDIKQYDSDSILALGGISQYEKNAELLVSAGSNLITTVNQQVKN